MTNPTLELLAHRISANFYDASRGLTAQQIADLVTFATQAPSSFHMQNWRFIAVQSAAEKARLQAVAYGQPKVSEAAVTFIVVGMLEPHKRLAHALGPALRAQVVDPATCDTWVKMATGMYEGNPQLQRDEAIRSASLAAMTLMVAAEAMGLASGPMIGFDPDGVRREFGLTDLEVPAMLLTVGFARSGNWPHKPRLPVSELLTVR